MERYVLIQGIKTKDNEFIPIWDSSLKFEKSKDYGNYIQYSRDNFYDLTELVFDLKTKTISPGVELNYYPEKTNYKKGESVLVEESHHELKEAIIDEIVFEEFDLEIKKGKKIEKYYNNMFPDVVFDNNTLYAVKLWKPFYILNTGEKIMRDYKLYKKIK